MDGDLIRFNRYYFEILPQHLHLHPFTEDLKPKPYSLYPPFHQVSSTSCASLMTSSREYQILRNTSIT
jgi:hypothetical protein